jgi:TldD protein
MPDSIRGLCETDADLAAWAAEEAKRLGAEHAEVRYGLLEVRRVTWKNGRAALLAHTFHRGLGVRARVGGAWGFASRPLSPNPGDLFPSGGPVEEEEGETPPLSAIDDVFEAGAQEAEAVAHVGASSVDPAAARDTIHAVAEAAIQQARAASSLSPAPPSPLAPPGPSGRHVWTTPRQRDPFHVPLEEILESMASVEGEARKAEKELRSVEVLFTAWRRAHWLVTTDGIIVLQEILECGGGIRCLAHREGVTQERTYPGLRGQHWETGGYEVFEALRLAEEAPRVAREAMALTAAPVCPAMTTDLVIDGSLAALQVHETIGHAVELDRVLGSEESLAGASHLTPDKLGWFRMGSDLVNVVADATAPCGLGSFGFDDEGTPGRRVPIIRNGIFVGYLSDRDSAGRLGLAAAGASRAQDWSHLPLIRMTNVNLLPGGWSLEEMIGELEHGFYFETARNPSIDHLRLNFFIPAEVAWEIRDGRRTRMYRDPGYGGVSYELWRSCDAIGDRRSWRIWGLPSCGKGDPSQVGHVGHGAAPVRMRGVRIGIGG